ncbi:MAG: 4Fe-4S dicluster domain-containing protein, partial [Myxococcota bacterium]
RGRSAVIVGSHVDAEVHAVVHRLNRALGNVGKTINYTAESAATVTSDSLDALVSKLNGGSVKTLVVMGVNPVYSAPKAFGAGEAVKKAGMVIHVADHMDETGELAKWHVPRSHFLETWGDVRAYDGTVSVIQPTIDPLQISFSDIEVLSLVLGGNGYGKDLVQATFAALNNIDLAADAEERKALEEKRSTAKGQGYNLPELYTSMDTQWRTALDAGFIDGTAALPETPDLLEFQTTAAEAGSLKPSEELQNGELELTFYADASLFDGRFANNGWLQEVPDYMTKICWDNAAIFSPNTAKKLGVHDEDLVTLTVGGESIEAAALVIPGQATNSVAIALGYGRTVTGRLGRQYDSVPYQTGFDAAPLRPKDGGMRVSGLTVKNTGKKYSLAAVQDHWAIDELGMKEREHRSEGLIRTTDLVHFKEKPDFVKAYEHGPQGNTFAIYKHPAKFDGHRWAMAIDLSKCIGCNACSIACQSENNIPVVGKEDVKRGREMHWIRIDRYFQGDPEEAQVAAQPIACMQCENAPCEQVCPVAATVHDEEGLNAMVYNRCIGTRYCSNNCPFKVRRFNWFQYHESDKNPDAVRQHMMYNPEVTVRFRGVMEKCTYCSQRIQNAKIHVKKVEKRELRDGDIVTACQQACPTGAIVFGDLADKKAKVSQLHERARSYGLLGELNLGVRTKFLAKVTNPNETLAPKHEGGGHGGHH